MKRYVIINANIITDGKVLPNHNIVVDNGQIISVQEIEPPPLPVIDAGGCWLAPGFIDMHIHGAGGYLADSGIESLEALSALLPHYGVTGFLTGVTPNEDDVAKLEELSKARSTGARMLGFFLEGHYLKLNGAISKLSKDYTPEHVEKLLGAAAPYKIVFAVSPEIKELEELLPLMTASGMPAFITHTMATPEQTARAISLGARHATHFYDVFPYPGETEPGRRACGVVEAILANKDATVDFILDGEHVEPVAIEMALACKGLEGVCLISDSNITAGLPPGVYSGLGGLEVEMKYEGGPARLTESGCLAGSGLTLDMAVRNAVKLLGLTPAEAIKLASENPARILGLDDRKGFIKPGYDADFSLLNENLIVKSCYVAGERMY